MKRQFSSMLLKSLAFPMVTGLTLVWGCGVNKPTMNNVSSDSDGATKSQVESFIPADKLAKIKAALPKVGYERLQNILNSSETFWYDHDVMTPTYQDSLGANTNAKWPNLVAVESVKPDFFDFAKKRWVFPFGTTAGTDRATNLRVENFAWIPQENGQPLSIPIWKVIRNAGRPEWNWVYPNTTTFGEVLFVTEGDTILPVEIRIRTRYATGWSMNAYRPFPTALELSNAIKAKRANWASQSNLKAMVDHLENNSTLVAKTLAAKGAMASTFRQDGYIDNLPDFGDAALVKELLTSTTFISSYGTAWKQNGSQKAYAANASGALSVVPNNYDMGVIEVTDESCMRCHKSGGRMVSEFEGALALYGEVWGKDGIFSFHPFDEKYYPDLRMDGKPDNRRINPKLKSMGFFTEFDSSKHNGAKYPAINTSKPVLHE